MWSRSVSICLWSLLCIVLGVVVSSALQAQKFYPDDPIWSDKDNLSIEKPQTILLSPTYDSIENILTKPDSEGPLVRATNVNTLGEVPDSSWFTNRIGRREISLEELVRGGDVQGGPDFSISEIPVVGARLGALTESLVVRDGRGDLYYLKFDPAEYPNMATGADVIATKFLRAAGYHVLPTCIVYVDPNRLKVRSDAKVSLLGGREVPMDQAYVDSMLGGAASSGNEYRVSASLLVSEDLLGRFRFFGTRPDDPNDIFLHENRRELRGYRLFAAWLNHVWSNSINTVDLFVEEGDRQFVRHFLLDFTSALGSGYDLNQRIAPKDPRSGYEYAWIGDLEASLKTGFSLGLWERPWMNVSYPYPQYREIGRIEGDFFGPEKWRPHYPNWAFERLLPDDAFWAVSIMLRFSREAIEALVGAGQYRDPEAKAYLVETLIKRKKKITDYYLRRTNPLSEFDVQPQAGVLRFRNLGVEEGLASSASYEYQWFDFDNRTGRVRPLTPVRYTGNQEVLLAEGSEDYLMVRIRTRAEDLDDWRRFVDVYLRNDGTNEVVGINREVGNSDLDRVIDPLTETTQLN